jgi:hypothetical protein
LTSLNIGNAGVASLSEALRASPASVTTPCTKKLFNNLGQICGNQGNHEFEIQFVNYSEAQAFSYILRRR